MAIIGLTGQALAVARIISVVVPSFLLFGYNQSNIGGVLDYPSFTKHFPAIDSTSTTGPEQTYHAKIQGKNTIKPASLFIWQYSRTSYIDR
jgi:hypothetical protein